MHIEKDTDRDLQRARRIPTDARPLMDFFYERDIIELGNFRVLIEPDLVNNEIIPKRKLSR
jgi:hypothetical protein